MSDQRLISVGRISGVFGVKGWVKVFSATEPKENILAYCPWRLEKAGVGGLYKVLAGATHGKGIIAQLQGINDRAAAEKLIGADISIDYGQLPKAEDGSFYWADLIGLRVLTTAGVCLGVVDHMLETGANDVLVVQGDRERLIPFIRPQTVTDIDLEAGVLVVDWDPEF